MNMWNGKVNFTSYNEVETSDNFRKKKDLNLYRKERLNKCKNIVKFLARLNPRPKLRVVEIGSGSSALMYALEQHGVLGEGVGLELSKSRYEFAERWKKDLKITNVKNINSDFVSIDFSLRSFDLFIVIDNTFTYLGPENKSYPDRLIKKAFEFLKPDGMLILEMHNYLPVLNKMPLSGNNFWKGLPSTNTFKYSLYQQDYNNKRNILRTESIYIASNGTEKRKVELSSVYSIKSLGKLLKKGGFKIKNYYANYVYKTFNENTSPDLIVTAKKAKQ